MEMLIATIKDVTECAMGRSLSRVYVRSIACVKVVREECVWFIMQVKLKQGGVITSWQFNVYIDGVFIEVNASLLGYWWKMLTANDRNWQLIQLLFV